MEPRNIPTTPKRGSGSRSLSPPEGAGDTNMASPISPLSPSSFRAPARTSDSRPIPSPSSVTFSRPTISLSPARFASTSNAFGLSSSSSSSSFSSTSAAAVAARDHAHVFGAPLGALGSVGTTKKVDISPPSAGTVTTRKLRRPSLLSLTRNASYTSSESKSDDNLPTAKVSGGFFRAGTGADAGGSRPRQGPGLTSPTRTTGTGAGDNPFAMTPLTQPTPRWPTSTFGSSTMIRRISSAPIIPFEDLKTSTPPLVPEERMDVAQDDIKPSGSGSGTNSPSMQAEDADGQRLRDSSLQWLPGVRTESGAASRKGKARMDDPPRSAIPLGAGAGTETGMGRADYVSPLFSTAPSTGSGETLHAPPFTARPLPSALVATLRSEKAPLEHEMLSEARLQRLITSHPQRLPFTPRAPRGSRGRFPDQVGGDDDDEEETGFGRRTSWTRRTWMGRKLDDNSDSDSDDDDYALSAGGAGEVNSAFAAGMDMDRPGSSSSSGMWISGKASDSGKSTPSAGAGAGAGAGGSANVNNQANGNGNGIGIGVGQSQGTGGAAGAGNTTHSPGTTAPTINPAFGQTSLPNNGQWPSATSTGPGPSAAVAGVAGVAGASGGAGGGREALKSSRLSFSSAGVGMVPSPGSGFGLPSAFGSLGMGGVGTPLGSPTIERLELVGSPGNGGMAISSPGLMQYRESSGGSASMRPGKRKAQQEDRYDPYKRPRGSSPSFSHPFSLNSSPFPLSPSRTSAIPIPQSPSHTPYYPSALSNSHGSLGHRGSLSSMSMSMSMSTRPTHPYTRPMNTRSRAASPALAVSLSASLGGGGAGGGAGGNQGYAQGQGPAQGQGQGQGQMQNHTGGAGGTTSTSGSGWCNTTSVPSGAAALSSSWGSNPPQQQTVHLGGLGLLSLAGTVEEVDEDLDQDPDQDRGRAFRAGARAGDEDEENEDEDGMEED